MDQKKYPEALRVAAIGLRYNPNSAMLFNNIGAIYANKNNYDSASIYYKKALKIKPKFEETLKNLAGCYYNLKKYDSCISTLQKLDIANDTYLNRLMNDAKLLQVAALKADSLKR
jgi:tetratricopeptide (TPR) repeat protein